MEHFSEANLMMAIDMVSTSRRDKAMNYINDIDRKQSVIAELLLRHALRETYSVTHLPEMCFGQNGKPMLQGENMPYFNISHCTLAVVCAVSDEEIGIDVEPYSSYCEDVAREVFNDEELAYVLGSPMRFAELWTMKESYLKYTGTGLSDKLRLLLPQVAGLHFRSFHNGNGYCCTTCAPDTNVSVPVYTDKESLFGTAN